MTATNQNPDDLLKEDEAAALLRVSVRTLQAWRTKSTGPRYVRLGRLVRYRRGALINYMNDNTNK